jgi:hypothetical protein
LKQFYVDPAINSTGDVLPPFESMFGDPSAGQSDVQIGDYETHDYDGVTGFGPIQIMPPPPGVVIGPLPYSTQVATFTPAANAAVTSSSVLGSNLVVPFPTTNGWMSAVSKGSAIVGWNALSPLPVPPQPPQLRPTADQIVLQGLPVIGFTAVNYINTNVTPGVLANYSGAYPLRTSVSCFQTGSTVTTVCSP